MLQAKPQPSAKQPARQSGLGFPSTLAQQERRTGPFHFLSLSLFFFRTPRLAPSSTHAPSLQRRHCLSSLARSQIIDSNAADKNTLIVEAGINEIDFDRFPLGSVSFDKKSLEASAISDDYYFQRTDRDPTVLCSAAASLERSLRRLHW